MNKIQIIINSVLAAAVVALFIVFFTVTPRANKPVKAEVVVDSELLPIAIINTDSILKHYTLAVESTDKLMSQYEASTVQLDTKAKASKRNTRPFNATSWISNASSKLTLS
ncbi:MAG: hypothetical protein J5612_00195 [Paludibacteraceae bacterium]|nr:hypothetical protein [Paludibacteraceae bacterium]